MKELPSENRQRGKGALEVRWRFCTLLVATLSLNRVTICDRLSYRALGLHRRAKVAMESGRIVRVSAFAVKSWGTLCHPRAGQGSQKRPQKSANPHESLCVKRIKTTRHHVQIALKHYDTKSSGIFKSSSGSRCFPWQLWMCSYEIARETAGRRRVIWKRSDAAHLATHQKRGFRHRTVVVQCHRCDSGSWKRMDERNKHTAK